MKNLLEWIMVGLMSLALIVLFVFEFLITGRWPKVDEELSHYDFDNS